tara:strand:+ start:354 stop:986 length:633 start_codon:yes stop_codon:yes gene_type:complete
MLKEKLGDSGLLALFYIWAFYEEYKSSGLKEPITKDSLLRAADSSIDDKLLFDTLVALKLIEDSPEGLTVHGFEPDLKSSCAPKGGSSSSGRAVVRSDQVRSVVDYYRTVNPSRGRAIKPGTQDWQRISARLKDGFTVEELKLAIDGNQLDPWHQKATNGHSSTYIFRNPEKVEGFIQTAKNGVKEDADEPIGHHRGSKEFNDGDQRARF